MLRRASTLALACVGVPALGQIPSPLPSLGTIFEEINRRLQIRDPFLVSPTSSNPFDIQPLEPPPKPGQKIDSPDDPKLIKVIHYDRQVWKGTTHVLEGNVEIATRGYRMRADVIEANGGVFQLKGDARLYGKDVTVRAHHIVVNTNDRTYEAYDSASDLKPSIVGGLVLSDVYVKGTQTAGDEKKALVRSGSLTTCRYDVPHFELDAKSIDARFERRIILRDVTVVVLQKPIIRLPFLVLPLDNRSYQNLPSFGESPVEGYFVKSHYGIPLVGAAQQLYSRLDYMTRLGLGIGGDYLYNHETAKQNPYKGTLSLYSVSQAGSLQIQQSQSGKVGHYTYQLENTYDSHDYFVSPTSVIQSTRAIFGAANKLGQIGLSYTRNDNSSPGFDSQQQSIGLTSTEKWNRLTTSARLTYNDSSTNFTGGTGNNNRETVDINLHAEDDLKKAQAIFDYQRSVPIGTIQNFLSSTDRTPNVTLQTDSNKLYGNNFDIPFKTSFSVGQFGTPIAGSRITRDFFNLSFDRPTDPNARAKFDVNGLFNQGFYSDGTAQYVLGLGGSMSYRLGSDTSFNLRYNYLRPEGFTPLGIDNSGKQNVATEDLSFRPARSLLMGLQTGYDANQPNQGLTPWQPLGVRLEYTPTKELLFRNLITYDSFIKSWANYRYDFSFKRGPTYCGLGGWYDNTRHIWTQTNIFVNALTIGRTRLDIRASYNGYTRQFDQRQLGFTYDLHDAELIVQIINNTVGYNTGTQFVLYLRLKAFPFDTNFGTGNRGQAIGTGTGIGY